jgi:hypothetical protein
MNSFYYFVTVINRLGKLQFYLVSKVDNFYQFGNLKGLISIIKKKKEVYTSSAITNKEQFHKKPYSL